MSEWFHIFLWLCLTALLQIRPSSGAETENWIYTESSGKDPAYAIYQQYRYAYERYGYLFFAGEESGRTEAGTGEQTGGKAGDLTVTGSVGPAGVADPGGAGWAAGGNDDGEAASGPGTLASGSAGEAMLAELARLQDYDYLMKHFYSVHPSTTADRELMNAEHFLQTDLRLEKNPEVPQILIYHTHSQETYADYGPGYTAATVVGNGKLLAELLREKGWNVIHDTSSYDMQGGKLDRNRAYTYALEGITRILQENPTIEVILDLHRDGVGSQTRLVSEVDGKPAAQIMFFQGMSRTPEGMIEYLPNPYISENLSFSFQMQFYAGQKYPGLTRKIYLKGLRYNLHLRPRSSLIEVGAQTNTSEEAQNAMAPLADLLDTVLTGNS